LTVADRIAAVLGRRPERLVALAGGCVGEVYRAEFGSGEPVVAKVDSGASGQLDVEGAMLEFLAPHLPVPAVLHAAPELLLMAWLPGRSAFDGGAERHAAELLAALHGVTAPACGFARDTLIGGLRQPNPPAASWVGFFAEHRLVYMAEQACAHQRLSARVVDRVRRLAADLPGLLGEPVAPALLHGDVWSGNVLAADGRITGFLDPAVYFGHPEVELAFITMFGTFGRGFFDAYGALRPIDPGFMAERRHLYNLYPYLVHSRLFGGSYPGSVEAILTRFGY
jgi:fructosamine-3-kinase